MINNLKVKNFKSIGENGIDIELKPLTILLGPNGSGKSSTLESIAVLGQSVRENNIKIKGDLLVYANMIDIFHKKRSGDWLIFEVRLKATEDEIKKLTDIYNRKRSDNVSISLSSETIIGYRLAYKFESGFIQSVNMGDDRIIAISEYVKMASTDSWISNLEFPNISDKKFFPEDTADKILYDKIFIPREKAEESIPFSEIATEIIKMIRSRIDTNHTTAGQIFFISAERGTIEPERNEEITRQKMMRYIQMNKKELKILGVGNHGQYLIPIISLICSNREYEEIYKKINKWASIFGLDRLAAGWKGEYKLGSDYVDKKLDIILGLDQASYGSKQILSVITQLFWSDPGCTIMIEEPEISLHPEAQINLAELFAEAVADKKQVIISTHSEYFPHTISIPIKKGLLKIEDIAVYHVEKDEKGTSVKRLELTPSGHLKEWIPSFIKVEDDLYKKSMDAENNERVDNNEE